MLLNTSDIEQSHKCIDKQKKFKNTIQRCFSKGNVENRNVTELIINCVYQKAFYAKQL